MLWKLFQSLRAKSYYNKLSDYPQSKCALIMFAKVLHERLSFKNYPVKIYAIHPGIIRSDLWTKHWFSNIGYLTTKFIAKTEEPGAQRVVYAALSPQADDLSGNYFENSYVIKPIALVRNRETQETLWEKSCQMLDISLWVACYNNVAYLLLLAEERLNQCLNFFSNVYSIVNKCE